ncbi:MAG TPA: hypothetical protein VJH63_00915 [Candidatus Paceibacterota bacterium]
MDRNIFDRGNLNPEPEKESKYRSSKKFVDTIKADLERSPASKQFFPLQIAFNIAHILRYPIDDLHEDFQKTDSHNAYMISKAYEEVRKLMDEKVIPKDSPWFSDLESKMSAIAILYTGANFDKDFAKKSKDGMIKQGEKDDAYIEFLRRKGLFDDYADMSGSESKELRDEFEKKWLEDNPKQD